MTLHQKQIEMFPCLPCPISAVVPVEQAHTWDDAVERWLIEQSHKASLKTDKLHIRWLRPHLSEKPLHIINRAIIDHITQAKIASGVSNATVNRMLALLRSILFKCAKEWEWIPKAPYVRMLKEPTRRIRFLTRDEAKRLLNELPVHLADMAAFSLATGLRRANVTGLLWSQVSLTRRIAWIHPDQAKARKAISVPLNDDAVLLIAKQSNKHPTHVFSYHGKPVTQVSTAAWYKALQRANIDNFRWHDLRHTWASWHVQGGTPLFALQELGGWESAEMVRRYAHLSSAHLSVYASNLESLAKPVKN